MVRDANGHAFFWWFGGDNLVFKRRWRSAEIRPPAIIEFGCLGLVRAIFQSSRATPFSVERRAFFAHILASPSTSL
jgi:hypothetical protein